MRLRNLVIWTVVALWAVAAPNSLSQVVVQTTWGPEAVESPYYNRTNDVEGAHVGQVVDAAQNRQIGRLQGQVRNLENNGYILPAQPAMTPAQTPTPQGGVSRMNIDAGTMLATLGVLVVLGFMGAVVFALFRNNHARLLCSYDNSQADATSATVITPNGGLVTIRRGEAAARAAVTRPATRQTNGGQPSTQAASPPAGGQPPASTAGAARPPAASDPVRARASGGTT